MFRKIQLPTTPEAFDALVEKLVKKYNLPDKRHAAAVIATEITHLPRHQDYTTEAHLKRVVFKNIANQVASFKGRNAGHEMQMDTLKQMLLEDPGNLQARDEIQKAANEGSEYAKKILAELDPVPAVQS